MTSRYLLPAVLLLSFVPLGCFAEKIAPIEPGFEPLDMAWLDKAMLESDEIAVYEGLPHSLFEKSDYETELKRVPVFRVNGEALYERPLNISELDRRKLSEAFSSGRIWVTPTSGPVALKLCGGFHADYAATLLKQKQPLASILICFGCNEVRLVRGKIDVTSDMTKDGRKELVTILKAYRQERPLPHRRDDMEELKPAVPKSGPPKIDYKN